MTNKDLAIALCRISSTKQTEGHSLEAQEQSVRNMAEELSVDIAHIWSITQSSKVGKNKRRRDLAQIKDFCRKNRRVKYLLVDRVSRLMREWKMMLVYTFELEELGVKVIFCDPSQRHLNGDDQISQLFLILEGFKTEQENKERGETTIARMKARYKDGYYLSYPHAGYMKSDTPGLHIPDPARFNLLQKAGHLIIYKQHTPEQAVKWLNVNNYRTRGGKQIDVGHFSEFIINPYYCGKIDIRSDDWPKGIDGLHTSMFSKREHTLLVAAITKRNPRLRQKNNPEFPLSNLLRHADCQDAGGYEKFTGHFRNPGKRNGVQRPKQPVYDCRDCRKRLTRNNAHNGFSAYLSSLDFLPSQSAFRRALLKAWRNQRGSMQQRTSSLKANKERLEVSIKETAAKYAQEPEGAAKNALRLLLEDYDKQLKSIDMEMINAENIEMESEDFVKFAFNFVETLKEKWWSLSPAEMRRGVQLLFNGKIYADNSANVRPLKLSSIYRLGTNKNDSGGVDFKNMVELAGTAPASAGLSWLVVYRHSSF